MKNIPLRLRVAALAAAGASVLIGPAARAQSGSPSLVNFDLEENTLADNPWAGVDSETGNLKVPLGRQLVVNESGELVYDAFGPSVAVGDLNGDGLPDLVVADSVGHLWFFPNSGTKTHAVFTHGEIIPVWFGPQTLKNVLRNGLVPNVQLIDFNGDGLLDLVVGTYDGSLYLLPNTGTLIQPRFQQPASLDAIRVPTRSDGRLWCNYLAPTLFNWEGRGVLDLVMGDGGYSANSIYLFHNQGYNGHFVFDENRMLRIIPGDGREHLTPRVVDWNGDGKPDIVCGERDGFIDLFLNTSTDPLNPTFTASHVEVGGASQFGRLTSVEIADLNGNKMPNLLISSDSGDVRYATNTGTPSHPEFASAPVPLKGVNPYPKIRVPRNWTFQAAFGGAYGLLVVTGADIQNGFAPPPGAQSKLALRSYVMTPQATIFPTGSAPPSQGDNSPDEQVIGYRPTVPLRAAANYEISFYVRADGNVQMPRYVFMAAPRRTAKEAAPEGEPEVKFQKSFSVSSSWQKVDDTFFWTSKSGDKNPTVPMKMTIRYQGSGSLYLDDISLRKSP